MRIPCNMRTCTWHHRTGSGAFYPSKEVAQVHGDQSLFENPRAWTGDNVVYAARLIVGLEPQSGGRVQSVNKVVRIVKQVRGEQVGDPASTFLTQRGLYKYEKSGKIADEPGVQVILFNVFPIKVPLKTFKKHVTELAEILADELDQETVIVEIQKNGVVVELYGMRAP